MISDKLDVVQHIMMDGWNNTFQTIGGQWFRMVVYHFHLTHVVSHVIKRGKELQEMCHRTLIKKAMFSRLLYF